MPKYQKGRWRHFDQKQSHGDGKINVFKNGSFLACFKENLFFRLFFI